MPFIATLSILSPKPVQTSESEISQELMHRAGLIAEGKMTTDEATKIALAEVSREWELGRKKQRENKTPDVLADKTPEKKKKLPGEDDVFSIITTDSDTGSSHPSTPVSPSFTSDMGLENKGKDPSPFPESKRANTALPKRPAYFWDEVTDFRKTIATAEMFSTCLEPIQKESGCVAPDGFYYEQKEDKSQGIQYSKLEYTRESNQLASTANSPEEALKNLFIALLTRMHEDKGNQEPLNYNLELDHGKLTDSLVEKAQNEAIKHLVNKKVDGQEALEACSQRLKRQVKPAVAEAKLESVSEQKQKIPGFNQKKIAEILSAKKQLDAYFPVAKVFNSRNSNAFSKRNQFIEDNGDNILQALKEDAALISTEPLKSRLPSLVRRAIENGKVELAKHIIKNAVFSEKEKASFSESVAKYAEAAKDHRSDYYDVVCQLLEVDLTYSKSKLDTILAFYNNDDAGILSAGTFIKGTEFKAELNSHVAIQLLNRVCDKDSSKYKQGLFAELLSVVSAGGNSSEIKANTLFKALKQVASNLELISDSKVLVELLSSALDELDWARGHFLNPTTSNYDVNKGKKYQAKYEELNKCFKTIISQVGQLQKIIKSLKPTHLELPHKILEIALQVSSPEAKLCVKLAKDRNLFSNAVLSIRQSRIFSSVIQNSKAMSEIVAVNTELKGNCANGKLKAAKLRVANHKKGDVACNADATNALIFNAKGGALQILIERLNKDNKDKQVEFLVNQDNLDMVKYAIKQLDGMIKTKQVSIETITDLVSAITKQGGLEPAMQLKLIGNIARVCETNSMPAKIGLLNAYKAILQSLSKAIQQPQYKSVAKLKEIEVNVECILNHANLKLTRLGYKPVQSLYSEFKKQVREAQGAGKSSFSVAFFGKPRCTEKQFNDIQEKFMAILGKAVEDCGKGGVEPVGHEWGAGFNP